MPKIKMKKGYPTSDGVMHDKHADAVKRQAEIDFREMMSTQGGGVEAASVIEKLTVSEMSILSDWIKYCCAKPVKQTPKKKSTVKK